ncbi:hypothetical protein [Stutzerimonas stutzeri]|uniref:hypothetical protein n=1 Tax=Stutzerimonas stutzeri TaxID=316 RepID=UPI0020B1E953|nr:hypothetical protein [Stutzerimonas stutzeri]MCP3432391.1 hypothetical protein [Stutzerimonas stutzeri]
MLPTVAVLSFSLLFLIFKRWWGCFFLALPAINITYFYISSRVFEFGKGVPFELYNEKYVDTYEYVQWMYLFSFLVVYMAFVIVGNGGGRSNVNANGYAGPGSGIKEGISNWWCWLTFSPVFFILLSVDSALLINRDVFSLPDAQHGWMRFADILFFPAAFLTPMLKSSLLRYLSLTLLVLFFSMLGSRAAPVSIIVFVLVDFFALGRRRFILQSALTVLAIYLLAVLLALRPSNEGGLLSFSKKFFFPDYTEILDFIIFGFNYIFNYSIVINARMLLEGVVEDVWFYYSILPLPSFVYDMTSGYDAANRFRVNIPYPGFGYALSFLGSGVFLLVLFFQFLAFFSLRRILVTRRDIVDNVVLAVVVLVPFLVVLQYNLRTGTRLLYAMTFLYFTVSVLRRVVLFRKHVA